MCGLVLAILRVFCKILLVFSAIYSSFVALDSPPFSSNFSRLLFSKYFDCFLSSPPSLFLFCASLRALSLFTSVSSPLWLVRGFWVHFYGIVFIWVVLRFFARIGPLGPLEILLSVLRQSSALRLCGTARG